MVVGKSTSNKRTCHQAYRPGDADDASQLACLAGITKQSDEG